MAGTHLNFPYDAELFNYSWKNTPDTILTTMLTSGAVVYDAEISRLIATGSNFFTTPYYNEIGGEAGIYNGINDITTTSITGGTYSGCVFGRQKGWDAKSFIKDFNSGADPMGQVVAGVARYWQRERQIHLIKMLTAVFGITGDADFASHTTNIATATASVTDANKIGVSTINDACVKANGDMADGYSLAIMHSVVANRLATLQLVEYKKYTDPRGITADMTLATINGKIIVINDNVPVKDSESATGEKEYTTFILGNGVIKYAPAPVDRPSEMERNPSKAGGMDFIYTRVREALHPEGFSFKGDVTTDVGIPDSTLFASASWERKMPAKSIYMTQIVTNG